MLFALLLAVPAIVLDFVLFVLEWPRRITAKLPEIVREKVRGIDDPDQRVLAMLGARGSVELIGVRGSGVAVAPASSEGTAAIIAA